MKICERTGDMFRFLLVSWIFVLSFVLPSSARTLTAGTPGQDLPVYETATLDESFAVLGKITVQAAQQSLLLREIKSLAKKHGGDAVLKYRVLEAGVFPHAKEEPEKGVATGLVLPAAEGIVIKFDKKGKKSIDESTVIPVLE